MTRRQETRGRRTGIVAGMLFGEYLSIDAIRRYAIILVTLVVCIIVYVAQKYDTQTKMETIQKLRVTLAETRSVAVEQRSLYMSQIRESSITARADSMHLGLVLQDRPPYVLEYVP